MKTWSTGEYELVEGTILGEGQVGICKHRCTEQECAVKMVQKSHRSTMVDIDMLRKADHPNIIKLRGVYQEGPLMYIVMDKCVGDKAIQPAGDAIDAAHIASVHYLHRTKGTWCTVILSVAVIL